MATPPQERELQLAKLKTKIQIKIAAFLGLVILFGAFIIATILLAQSRAPLPTFSIVMLLVSISVGAWAFATYNKVKELDEEIDAIR